MRDVLVKLLGCKNFLSKVEFTNPCMFRYFTSVNLTATICSPQRQILIHIYRGHLQITSGKITCALKEEGVKVFERFSAKLGLVTTQDVWCICIHICIQV